MKKLFFALMVLAGIGIQAKPVNSTSAKQVGCNYLLNATGLKTQPELSLKYTYTSNDGTPTIYVFDIDQTGFILVSADDMVEPVLGYSFNGPFDINRVSPSFISWSNAYSEDIAAAVSQQNPLDANYIQAASTEWQALQHNDISFYAQKDSKDVDALVTSTWDQGYGYNEFCPEYSNGPGGHSYTGCVATAMAQIIRYWGYPSTGFGTSTYSHFRYGRQTAVHDSVIYDYANMPNAVNYYSSSTQKQAVSLLCYHCGVSVEMDYQSVDKPDGSGAHTEDVADAIKHFGYFEARHAYLNDLGTEQWKELVRNEINNGRPILYRGVSGTYGHAFVCDGYRASQDKYHFNWGWSGYQDGYYTMSNMNGYTSGQGGIYNIKPSYLASQRDTFYVSPDGIGDGSSWEQTTSQLNDVMQARKFYKSGIIYMKEGIYYGDTTSSAALTISNGVRIYGGFEGTESNIADRDTANHHTIIDGMGCRAVIDGRSFTKSTYLYDVTIQNGRSNKCAAIPVTKNLSVIGCTIKNCVADSTGDICTIADGTLRNCTFYGNIADSNNNGTIIYATGGELRNLRVMNNSAWANVANAGGKLHNSLISHNKGVGVRVYNRDAQVINCDIVYNEGTGLSLNSAKEVRNSVIYANSQAIDTNAFDNMTFCALDGEIEFTENGNIHLNETTPVFWMDMSPRGPHADNDWSEYSWHLKVGSPCIDSGDTITTGLANTDIEGRNRVINGRVDMGCMERRHNIGIDNIETFQLNVYPNPANGIVTINGAQDANYEMYDIYGRLVASWKHCPEQMTIDLSSFSNGIYILHNGNISTRIIKH